MSGYPGAKTPPGGYPVMPQGMMSGMMSPTPAGMNMPGMGPMMGGGPQVSPDQTREILVQLQELRKQVEQMREEMNKLKQGN
jgi:hypothetical protein